MSQGHRERTRVVILGWYGSDNTGDEAVLEGVVGALRHGGIRDLHVLSTNPAKTASRLSVASTPRSLWNVATLRALRGARALVLGGGGLIQDRTSLYNLPVYAFYVLAARLFGLRVIGWGLGVEPLDTALGKMLARYICASSAYFSVRDGGSRRLLAGAGVPPQKIAVSADPAFLIAPAGAGRRARGEERVVAFCLRDLPDNRPGLNLHYLLPISVRRVLKLGRSGRQREREEAFTYAMARAVRLCTDELRARVVFLPLWPGRDDRTIQAVVSEAEKLGVRAEMMGICGAANPQAVADAIAGCDLLVSMRLHALIFGAGAGVPALGLAYARKVRGLMRSMEAERWVVEVESRNPPPEEIEMKLRLLWAMRDAEARNVSRAAEGARLRAEMDADAIALLLGGEQKATG